MIELPFEKSAMHNEEMPSGLDLVDAEMYQALALLYRRFYNKEISRETASREKRDLVDAYSYAKSKMEQFKAVARLWPRAEVPASRFRKEPTLENAVAFYNAIYQTNWSLNDEVC